MISYQHKQEQLFNEIEKSFKLGQTPSTLVEPVKDFVNDTRACLTSVVFIPQNLQQVIISKVINPLRDYDSEQYFYVPNSFHLTIQNVRTVNDPPLFGQKDIKRSRLVFRRIVPKYAPFSFELRGLFELPTNLSIRAYSAEVLKDLILELRDGLEKAGIPDNKTYASDDIFFGNINVCRFIKEPNRKFKNKVKELKEVFIGNLNVETISLITTNSVCHPAKTRIIDTFNLQS